jgi:AraC-like DNA-binding protein
MQMERHIPVPALQPFIRDILFIECATPTQNLVLPDILLNLVIRFKGAVSLLKGNETQPLPLATLTGLTRSPKQIAYSANAANLLIRFLPGGAAAFFKEPLHEFMQLTAPAIQLKGYSDLNTVAEQLAAMRDNAQRLSFIQRLLLSRLHKETPDALIHAAFEKINAAKGTLSMHGLSQQLYLSQDAFEKRFRQQVGITAKHFSSNLRLRNAIDSYSPTHTLTHLAHTAGFFDQAHFTKEFHLFTGHSPRQFFQSARFW